MSIAGALPKIEVERAPTGKHVADAWGTSRPNDQNSKLIDVLKIDVPVNEMEDFILRIKAPIIIREMLFSFRDHVAWARTSRVDNLDEWEVALGYETNLEVLACYEMMQRLKQSHSQDNFREMLPLVYMTEFTIKLSARTLMRFTAALHELVGGLMWKENHIGGHGNLLHMFSAFGVLLKNVIGPTPYGDLPVNVYGEADLLPELKAHGNKNKATRMGDFVHVFLEQIPIVLRAQIVRHRPISFVDTLSAYITPAEITSPINSRINLAMVMPATMAYGMLTKRNCWIAQEDLWLPVIKALNDCFGDDGDFPLPCHKSLSCPFGRDNLLRHEGKDPAPACPIWYGMAGHPKPDGEQRAAIMGYMDKRTYSKGLWQDIYLNAIPDEGA
jgi:hypothetical protein